MEIFQKLALLSENMDVVEEDHRERVVPACHSRVKVEVPPNITHAHLPGGRTTALLKTMVTSVCEKNCLYCAFRSGRDSRRATFTPDELADTFLKLVDKRVVEGLFLSSGVIAGGPTSQDKIIATAEILRKKKNFRGYLHLKIMPGAEKDQIRELMRHADRVSINLEAPNPSRLAELAPRKNFFEELFTRLRWAAQIRKEEVPQGNWKSRWPSFSTQFVVGAGQETDLELVKSSQYLFSQLGLARVYYSSFSPVLDTPFEDRLAENPMRKNRLYQSFYLLRDYGFNADEFTYDPAGHLLLNQDPKTVWAEAHLLENPLEINQASVMELMRVPGIGPLTARRIIESRRKHPVKTENDLQQLLVSHRLSARYLLLNGKSLSRQLSLF